MSQNSARKYPRTIDATPVRPTHYEAPPSDASHRVNYYSDPIGKAFSLAIIVGVAAVPLIAITIAIVHLGNAKGMWGLLIFGVMLLAMVMFLYHTERRYSAEGIDLRRIDALENVELARVQSEQAVQMANAAILQLQAETQRESLARSAERVRSAQPPIRLGSYVPPVAPPAADDEDEEQPRLRSPWVMPTPIVEPLRGNPVVEAMMEWAREVHEHSGSDGRIHGSVPWGKRGALNTQQADMAQEWLRRVANAQGKGWVVRYDKLARGWKLNKDAYPTAQSLIDGLAAATPPQAWS